MGKIVAIALICMIVFTAAGRGDGMYIRVVSRDDSADAQMEKIRVRDAVLPLLPEDAERLAAHWDAICDAANAVASCQVQIRPWAPEGMPMRDTLYITVGGGEGPNWWGILYRDGPALLGKAAGEEEYRLYFPLVQWLLQWLGW
ncbi:MAG: hypothetical protein E7324_08750 [Clostridiales bacterium]|nr:hypothetical protein [Clostridiales bacterium]